MSRQVSHAISLGVALSQGECLMPHPWERFRPKASVSCYIPGISFVPRPMSHATSLGMLCPKASVSCYISENGFISRRVSHATSLGVALYHGGCLMPHLWEWFCPKASVSCHTPCQELCPRVGVLCTTLTMALSCWEVSLYAANLIANVTGRSYHFYPLL